jgi:hypothetical protein
MKLNLLLSLIDSCILCLFSLFFQAYIQQLESSRIRLSQLEQQVQTARVQVHNGSPRIID